MIAATAIAVTDPYRRIRFHRNTFRWYGQGERVEASAGGTLAMAMPYLLVLLVSLLVGVGAYLVTVRAARADASLGFGDEEEELGPPPGDPARPGHPPPGYAYLQVSTQAPALRDRLLGFIGLVLLVAISMAVLAFAIYEIGHLINRTIEAFLD